MTTTYKVWATRNGHSETANFTERDDAVAFAHVCKDEFKCDLTRVYEHSRVDNDGYETRANTVILELRPTPEAESAEAAHDRFANAFGS